MKFHLPSFLMGCVTGAVTRGLAPRLRPVAVELGAAAFRLLDMVKVQAARRREDLVDLVVEARARADGLVAGLRDATRH